MNSKLLSIIVIVMVASLFLGLLFMNTPTGLVTDPRTSQNTAVSPEIPQASQCIDKNADTKCGTSCWLDSDSSPPSTFDQSRGKIGVVSWDGRCRDVLNTLDPDAVVCCSTCDCPIDHTCDRGLCKFNG